MQEHIAIHADLLDQTIDQRALIGPAGIGIGHRNQGNENHSRLALEQAQINGEQFPIGGEQAHGGAVEQKVLASALVSGPGAGGFQLGQVLGAVEAFPFELLQQPREPDPLNLDELLSVVVLDPKSSPAVVESSPGDLFIVGGCIVGGVDHGADCSQPAAWWGSRWLWGGLLYGKQRCANMISSSPTSPNRSARATRARFHTPRRTAGAGSVQDRGDSSTRLPAPPPRSAARPRRSASLSTVGPSSTSCPTSTPTRPGRRRVPRRRRTRRCVPRCWPARCVTPSTQSTSTRFAALAPTSTENHGQAATRRSYVE